MVQARIYKPCKTAMQSGKAKTHTWVLEFYPRGEDFIEPVMGWKGSNCTLHQIRLTFESLEMALAYAKKQNIAVQVEASHESSIIPKQYADNFRYDRVR
ncbi:MAG: ETC complex I subunit [Alphaproteobacteria bacterium]|nr:ETC complex I subunit [Alphaproteobacteria bacterium]